VLGPRVSHVASCIYIVPDSYCQYMSTNLYMYTLYAHTSDTPAADICAGIHNLYMHIQCSYEAIDIAIVIIAGL